MTIHLPILAKEIGDYLFDDLAKRIGSLPDDATIGIADLTFGGGGHTGHFLERAFELRRIHGQAASIVIIGIDQDGGAIARGSDRFNAEIAEGRLILRQSRFSDFQELLRTDGQLRGIHLYGLLADLGYSSDQLEDPARGLSFLKEGPLDMRLDRSQGVTARQLLLQKSEQEIAQMIWELGEDRFSRVIAKKIVQARTQGHFPETTTELAKLIESSVPPVYRYGRIHAATRTFQALRIEVNRELEELDRLLGQAHSVLERGGRAAIISFHSLEDRKVKWTFRKREEWSILTKKPIEASDAELERNPRSRSAKLRVAESC